MQPHRAPQTVSNSLLILAPTQHSRCTHIAQITAQVSTSQTFAHLGVCPVVVTHFATHTAAITFLSPGARGEHSRSIAHNERCHTALALQQSQHLSRHDERTALLPHSLWPLRRCDRCSSCHHAGMLSELMGCRLLLLKRSHGGKGIPRKSACATSAMRDWQSRLQALQWQCTHTATPANQLQTE